MIHSEVIGGKRITIYGRDKTEVDRKRRELGLLKTSNTRAQEHPKNKEVKNGDHSDIRS